MPKQWFRGLSAATRDRYPALLSYAAMLTPDLDEARTLTDDAIAAVMGSLRPPRSDLLREAAIRDRIARAYVDKHPTDAVPGYVPYLTSAAPKPAADAYAPPTDRSLVAVAGSGDAHDPAPQPAAPSGIALNGIGVGQSTSPLAVALANLSPAERVAAVTWWIDGASADDVADRLNTTHYSAVDALHRAGIALAAASASTAPNRDHYDGGGDVVTVEVYGGGGRA